MPYIKLIHIPDGISYTEGEHPEWNNTNGRFEPGNASRTRSVANTTGAVTAGDVLVGPGGDSTQTLDADLIDYTGINFDVLDLYIDGKFMSPGATEDVYTAVTASDITAGGFRATFDIPSGAKIQVVKLD